MENYSKVLQQLGTAFKKHLITMDEYREIVRDVDSAKNNLKNPDAILNITGKLLNSKTGISREDKDNFLKEIKKNI